jgi:hypothetical protein
MTSPPIPKPLSTLPPPWRRKSTGIGLAIIVVLAAATAAGFWLAGSAERSRGPLHGNGRESIGMGRVRVGQVVAYGQPLVFNGGSRPAVLKRIWLVDAPAELRVLETHVSGPARKHLSSAGDFRWPTPEFQDLHPVRGFAVAPETEPAGERGAELVFVLRADKPGRLISRGIGVDYTVDGKAHRQFLTSGFAICPRAKGEKVAMECAAPPLATIDELDG